MKHIKIFIISLSLILTTVLLSCTHSVDGVKKESFVQNPKALKSGTSVSFYRDSAFTVVQECSSFVDTQSLPNCKPGEGQRSVRIPFKDFISSYKDFLSRKIFVSSDWERELDYIIAGLPSETAKTRVIWENFNALIEQTEYLVLEIEKQSNLPPEFFKIKSQLQSFKNQNVNSAAKVPRTQNFITLKSYLVRLIELTSQKTPVVFSPLKNEFGFRFLQSYLNSDVVRSLANTEGLSHLDFGKLLNAQAEYLSVAKKEDWSYLPQYLAMHDAYNAVDAKYRTYAPMTFSTNESQFEVGELAAINILELWTLKFAPPKSEKSKKAISKFKKFVSDYRSGYDLKTKKDALRLSQLVFNFYLKEHSKMTSIRTEESDLQVVSLKSDIKSFLSRVRSYSFADALRLTAGEALFTNQSSQQEAGAGTIAGSYWLMNVINEKHSNFAPDLNSIDSKPFVLVTRSAGFEDQARSTASGAFTNFDDLFDTKSESYTVGKKLAEQFWSRGALAPINGANDSKKSYLESH